ncbi:expressed unknown protein [Seminavis robusta]|uniref:Uncharacterized protein n=1 Tax=Seminavis robusta TaxID=568900 RepID=A0A9N8DBF8_9STRA|nr:expressed unknown protein [Seminavis robusta]|eukprot:Sro24_g016280.1 n/a (126) ;mRNA; f:26748-27125
MKFFKQSKANKVSGNEDWTNDLKVLEAVRNEIAGSSSSKRGSGSSSRRSSRSHSTKGKNKKDCIDANELQQLHQLVRMLKEDGEGKELLERFVEKQADLPLDSDDQPPIKAISVPRSKKQTSRAA